MIATAATILSMETVRFFMSTSPPPAGGVIRVGDPFYYLRFPAVGKSVSKNPGLSMENLHPLAVMHSRKIGIAVVKWHFRVCDQGVMVLRHDHDTR